MGTMLYSHRDSGRRRQHAVRERVQGVRGAAGRREASASRAARRCRCTTTAAACSIAGTWSSRKRGISFAHPVARTHPATGRKALYVNRLMTHHIEGLPREESEQLLALMFETIERPEFIYEHRWRVGDLVLWDNRCTLHARRDFDPNENRWLRRVTIQGERPR